jgi:hypothetical protein
MHRRQSGLKQSARSAASFQAVLSCEVTCRWAQSRRSGQSRSCAAQHMPPWHPISPHWSEHNSMTWHDDVAARTRSGPAVLRSRRCPSRTWRDYPGYSAALMTWQSNEMTSDCALHISLPRGMGTHLPGCVLLIQPRACHRECIRGSPRAPRCSWRTSACGSTAPPARDRRCCTGSGSSLKQRPATPPSPGKTAAECQPGNARNVNVRHASENAS